MMTVEEKLEEELKEIETMLREDGIPEEDIQEQLRKITDRYYGVVDQKVLEKLSPPFQREYLFRARLRREYIEKQRKKLSKK